MELFLVASVQAFTHYCHNKENVTFKKIAFCMQNRKNLVSSAFLMVCYMDAIYYHMEVS